MQNREFTESDWKLFKFKIAGWQEAYIDRLNKEYIELLSKNAEPSELFWTLDKKLREDKKKTGVRIEMRRSIFISNVILLINEGVIGLDELKEFSDELQETIKAFLERKSAKYGSEKQTV